MELTFYVSKDKTFLSDQCKALVEHVEPRDWNYFFSEKNFDRDQKLNPRNDRFLCREPGEVPTASPVTIIVLEVVDNAGDVIRLHVFPHCLRIYTSDYNELSERFLRCKGRLYTYQQDSVQLHKVKRTKECMNYNLANPMAT